MALRWQEPPTSRNIILDGYADDAKALRSKPGEWAVLDTPEGKVNLVTAVKAGEGPFAPKGDFQARRYDTPKGPEIYVRYMGGVVEGAAEEMAVVNTEVAPATEPW